MSNEQPIIKQTTENPEYAIIWLHGLSADGNDFVPVIPALNIPENIGVRFIFPHAPVRPITINGGMQMRGWYDITSLEFIRDEDREGFEASNKIIETLINQQVEKGIAPEKIILAGFSQGGALALYHGLRRDKPLAGIIALSCYLPFHENVSELSEISRQTPIFMAHGKNDDIVPFEKGELSKQLLIEHDYNVSWYEYPMGHSVNIEEIQQIGEFIKINFN